MVRSAILMTGLIAVSITVAFAAQVYAQGSPQLLSPPAATSVQTPGLERTLAVQRAMAAARHLLEQQQPVEAVKALEAVLHLAEGQPGYLELLRHAYQAELKQWEEKGGTDPRIGQLKRYIDLLHQSPLRSPPLPQPENSVSPKTSTGVASGAATSAEAVISAGNSEVPLLSDVPSSLTTSEAKEQNLRGEKSQKENALNEAILLFQQKKYAEAAQRFALVEHLSSEHKTAWAYCRIHRALERLQQKAASPATIQAAIDDLQAARDLLPENAELRRYADQALRVAQQKARHVNHVTPLSGQQQGLPTNAEVRTVEAASFRIIGSLPLDQLEELGRDAEKYRQELFERWSGPAVGPWQPRCDIVIYAKAEEFTQATGLSPEHQSLAQVKLTDGHVVERRIHLYAGSNVGNNGWKRSRLRRELMHVILADLFPQSPPRWAVEGITVSASGAEELERYQRTLQGKIPPSDWISVSELFELRDYPVDRITIFCCQSASLVDYLIRTGGGEKNFIIFLRDSQRYGTAAALRRQYGYASPAVLESAWMQWVLRR
jgi:tetratricopeptide (TPR) repeat protein